MPFEKSEIMRALLCSSLQMLRVRFSKGSAAANDPTQHIAPIGSPSDCLAAVHLDPACAADVSMSDGVCRIVSGAPSTVQAQSSACVIDVQSQYLVPRTVIHTAVK